MNRSWLGASAAAALTALAVTAAGLSVAPARQLIETSMVWHMGVQMPLLLLTGWLVCLRYPGAFDNKWINAVNHEGLTSMLVGSFILAYWMLPLAIDQALIRYSFDLFKIMSLILCGAVLRDFFYRSHWVIQLFFLGYTLPMLIGLGFYFANTDLRLCNAYSLESQVRAGHALIGIALLLGAFWLIRTTSLLRLTTPEGNYHD